MTTYAQIAETTPMIPNRNPRIILRLAPLGAAILTAALMAPAWAANPSPATKANQKTKPAATAASAAGNAKLSQIWRVAVDKKTAETVINVETLPGLPAYSHFILRHPDRWVLDFQSTADAMPRHRWTEKTKNLADIRVGQFQPSVARVVLDLHRAVTPTVTPLAHGLRITIPDGPAAAAQPAVASAPVAAASKATAESNAKKLAAARRAARAAWHPAPAPAAAEAASAPAPAVASTVAPPAAATAAPAPDGAASPSPAKVEPVAMSQPPSVPNAARTEARAMASSASSTGAATGGPPTVAGGQAGMPVLRKPEAYPTSSANSASPLADSMAAAASASSSAAAPVTPRGVAPESLRLPLNQAIQGINPGTGEPTVYTGERITLNLKDASLTDFFRLINQISGLNIIVDPSVHGEVTMVLQDVPWDQALDLVLRNNSLSRTLEGNTVYIDTDATQVAHFIVGQKMAEARRLERVAQENLQPYVTRFIRLNYADAQSVASILNGKAGGGSSSGGSSSGGSSSSGSGTGGAGGGFRILRGSEGVTVYPGQNAILLRVHPDSLPKIDALLAEMDRRVPQVQIRAKVVSASRQFIRELGVQLGFGAGNAANMVGGLNSVGNSQTALSIANPKYATNSGLLPLNLNLGATAPTSGLGFINASSSFRLDAMLSAAEQKGLGHVLSQPSVITQDNQEADVQQGVRLPVQTTINNTISVQFFNVTLELQVKPRITADHHVFLTVKVKNDAIDQGIPPVNGIPAIDTESATTQVLVANGSTVVIGGVMVNNNQNSVFQVPLLGSIPVIGDLFKHTVVNNQTQELLFFITPTIIGG